MHLSIRYHVRSFAVLVLSLGIMACGDASPTAVEVPEQPLANTPELLLTLDDVQDRVLLGFPANAIRSELGASLVNLRVMIALAATDAAAVPRAKNAIAQVRNVLQRHGPVLEQNGLAADVDVISMGLDVVGESLVR